MRLDSTYPPPITMSELKKRKRSEAESKTKTPVKGICDDYTDLNSKAQAKKKLKHATVERTKKHDKLKKKKEQFKQAREAAIAQRIAELKDAFPGQIRDRLPEDNLNSKGKKKNKDLDQMIVNGLIKITPYKESGQYELNELIPTLRLIRDNTESKVTETAVIIKNKNGRLTHSLYLISRNQEYGRHNEWNNRVNYEINPTDTNRNNNLSRSIFTGNYIEYCTYGDKWEPLSEVKMKNLPLVYTPIGVTRSRSSSSTSTSPRSTTPEGRLDWDQLEALIAEPLLPACSCEEKPCDHTILVSEEAKLQVFKRFAKHDSINLPSMSSAVLQQVLTRCLQHRFLLGASQVISWLKEKKKHVIIPELTHFICQVENVDDIDEVLTFMEELPNSQKPFTVEHLRKMIRNGNRDVLDAVITRFFNESSSDKEKLHQHCHLLLRYAITRCDIEAAHIILQAYSSMKDVDLYEMPEFEEESKGGINAFSELDRAISFHADSLVTFFKTFLDIHQEQHIDCCYEKLKQLERNNLELATKSMDCSSDDESDTDCA